MNELRWTIRLLAGGWIVVGLDAAVRSYTEGHIIPFDVMPWAIFLPVLALGLWGIYCVALLQWRGQTAWPELALLGVMLMFPIVGVGVTVIVIALIWGGVATLLRRVRHGRSYTARGY